MKKYPLLFALLLLWLTAPASQIVVGLRSDNLVSWNVWERQGPGLKHHLLLYNKGPQEIAVAIKLKRFTSDGSHFQDVPTNQTFHRLRLPPQQLVRVKYPKGLKPHEFLEYFENERSIGLLPASTDRPDVARQPSGYRFYTDQSANSGAFGYWVALDFIDAPPTRLALTAAEKFYAPSKFLKANYHLVKLYSGAPRAYPRSGVLDSLVRAPAPDRSIVRLDDAHRSAVLPVDAGLAGGPGFLLLAIYIELVDDGYYYDEAKRLVPEKRFGGTVCFIPVFPRAGR